MDPIEQGIFEIIGYTGQAKSLVMQAIQAVENGDFSQVDTGLTAAHQLQTKAQQAHLQLATIKSNSVPLNLILMLAHAETHLMLTEQLFDLWPGILKTNQRLSRLEK
jgi:cellobiose-specific phosphotransferase system component IIA